MLPKEKQFYHLHLLIYSVSVTFLMVHVTFPSVQQKSGDVQFSNGGIVTFCSVYKLPDKADRVQAPFIKSSGKVLGFYYTKHSSIKVNLLAGV